MIGSIPIYDCLNSFDTIQFQLAHKNVSEHEHTHFGSPIQFPFRPKPVELNRKSKIHYTQWAEENENSRECETLRENDRNPGI